MYGYSKMVTLLQMYENVVIQQLGVLVCKSALPHYTVLPFAMCNRLMGLLIICSIDMFICELQLYGPFSIQYHVGKVNRWILIQT